MPMFWKRWKKKKQVEIVTLIENGFEITVNEDSTVIKWSSIDRLVGYKIDQFTIDEICLYIEYDNKNALVTEDYSGWRKFMIQLLSRYPNVDKNWEMVIEKPAFERNETELFVRTKSGTNMKPKFK